MQVAGVNTVMNFVAEFGRVTEHAGKVLQESFTMNDLGDMQVEVP
jgi:hypothetical protein